MHNLNFRKKDKDVIRIHRDENEFHIATVSQINVDRPNVSLNIEANGETIRIRKKCYEVFDDFFDELVHEIQSIGITNQERDKVYNLMEQLVIQHKNLLLSDNSNVNDDSTSYVCEQIQKFKTHKLRLSQMRKSKFFVEPETKNIGLKWKTTTVPDQEIPDHTLVAATYQYIPVLKTLQSLFADPKFREEYETYNKSGKHKCQDGVYEDFCCGSLFKKSEFFKNNPNAIQIELSTDDFEVCSPLKSKAVKHKVCGVYFRIRNLPPYLNSKLPFVYLGALCPAAYLKRDGRTFQDIAQLFVQELSILETIGIEISPGNFLKGTLINTAFDNLGGNGILGFVECFVANYPCRICECARDEFQGLFVEDVGKLRKKEEYIDLIRELEDESDGVNIKGIKAYSVLNDLKYFHMFDNRAVDLMHDMNEGQYFIDANVNKFVGSLFILK